MMPQMRIEAIYRRSNTSKLKLDTRIFRTAARQSSGDGYYHTHTRWLAALFTTRH
jgi:hypothetical protein